MEAVGVALLGLAVFVALASKKRASSPPPPPDGSNAPPPDGSNAPPPDGSNAPPPYPVTSIRGAINAGSIDVNSVLHPSTGCDKNISLAALYGISQAASPMYASQTSHRQDIVGDVADDENDWYTDDWNVWVDDPSNARGGRRIALEYLQARFYRQMWLPASKIRLSELSFLDIKNAFLLLGYKVDFAEYRGRDSEGATQSVADTNSDWASAVQWIETIVSFVPIAGGIASTVAKLSTASEVNDLNKVSADLEAQLKNPEGAQYTWTKRMSPPPATLPGDLSGNPAETIETGPNGESFYARRRIVGLLWGTDNSVISSCLRWNCKELGGTWHDDTSRTYLQHRTIERAYVYRALDLIACALYPYSQKKVSWIGDGAGGVTPDVSYSQPTGLYQYCNPIFGKMYGSIFPPTDEDTPIESAPPPQAQASAPGEKNLAAMGPSLLAALGIR